MRATWNLFVALLVVACLSPSSQAQNCGVWESLGGPSGSGVSGWVYALTVHDDGTGPALYAGGNFSTAGGVTVNKIARWDGSTWSALTGLSGTGMSGGSVPDVYALTVFDDGTGPALYAGGNFTIAGGVTTNYIARWDGTEWSPLAGPSGTGMNWVVNALTVFDDGTGPALYAGGYFSTAGGITVNGIARWDGSEWSALTDPSGTGTGGVHILQEFDDGTGPALYVGGFFTTAGGVEANRIASWDGSEWSALASPSGTGMNSAVTAMSLHNDGSGPALYVGGFFTTAGGVEANRVARWDGSHWSALTGPFGEGVSGEIYFWSPQVDALTEFDDGTGLALYVGGWFFTAGGVATSHIARWDGSAWSPLVGPSGTGVNNRVRALTVFDDGTGPALYAGGDFTAAGGVTDNGIARWRPRPPCLADLNSDCVLDVSDVQAFAAAFQGGDLLADFTEPFGVFDLADVVAFVQAFQAGCP